MGRSAPSRDLVMIHNPHALQGDSCCLWANGQPRQDVGSRTAPSGSQHSSTFTSAIVVRNGIPPTAGFAEPNVHADDRVQVYLKRPSTRSSIIYEVAGALSHDSGQPRPIRWWECPWPTSAGSSASDRAGTPDLVGRRGTATVGVDGAHPTATSGDTSRSIYGRNGFESLGTARR